MIQLSELTKSFADRTLLDHVTWQIGDRERVGLCGPNGAGKTTLLRMMAGLDEPDSGAILKPSALTVGYLPQDGLSHAGRTVFEEATLAFRDLLAMKAEMHELEERLGDPSIPEAAHEGMLGRYADLQDRFRVRDGYSIELKTATVLQGLGFKTADFERRTETFSGGWQMRLALAKLLLGQPSLLLLDEPTNHLDLEARNWLETYLERVSARRHPGLARPFLPRRRRDPHRRSDAADADRLLRQLQPLPRRARSAPRAAPQGQARAGRRGRRASRCSSIGSATRRPRRRRCRAASRRSRRSCRSRSRPSARRSISIFPSCGKSGRTVLELQHVRKAYGDLVVFRDLGLHIERGDRIALVGVNGAGKSTLMRMLSGAEAPDGGERIEGHHVVMQYFAQDEATRMDPAPTVYETLQSGSPNAMVPAIRNILGGFLFSGDDVYKKVRVLSGGERTRLAVARMLLRPSNTLLLDEPTNHLDLDSKEVLLDALVDFGGTLIFVSHDRYFVERLATKIVEVGERLGDRLSRHLRRVPLAQGTSRRSPAPGSAPLAPPQRRSAPRGPPGGSGRRRPSRPPPRPPSRQNRDDKKTARRRGAAPLARRRGASGPDRRARITHRRRRTRDPRDRRDHGRRRVLLGPGCRAAGDRPTSITDVGGR